jgi:outer membrane protein OmpA-like peptidoglycan-associated protein
LRTSTARQPAGTAAGNAQKAADAAAGQAQQAQAAGKQADARAAALEAETRKLILETVISEDSGKFQFGTADLPDGAKQAIDQLVARVKGDRKNVWIEIEGHTDNVGDAQCRDEALGLQRAEAVNRCLYEQHQIPLHKMNTISYGERKPAAENRNPWRRSCPEPPCGDQGPVVSVSRLAGRPQVAFLVVSLRGLHCHDSRSFRRHSADAGASPRARHFSQRPLPIGGWPWPCAKSGR